MSTRILIVEDEEALTLLLRYNLEAEGFEVDAVAGATRRISACASRCRTSSSSTG